MSHCDIQVDNIFVSRHHADIEKEIINGEARYTIFHVYDINGTFVNNHNGKPDKVEEKRSLKDRDHILVCGKYIIIFHAGDMHKTGETYKLTYKI